jgi:hypothetical protein
MEETFTIELIINSIIIADDRMGWWKFFCYPIMDENKYLKAD